MKTNIQIRLILASILLIFIHKSYGQDGAWPGLDLGTIACSSTSSPSGNTSGASTDCGVSSAGDHIYQFTIAFDADVTVDVCGASWDTQIHLFALSNGNCNAGSIASNDDFCGLQSSITQTGLAAGSYVVIVEGYSSNEGAYTLNIAVSNCVNPDDPCGASSLDLCTTPSDGTNSGMTASAVAAPSCGNYSGGDLWYKVTVPTSGELQVEAMSNTLTDMAMAMYTVSGGCGGTFTQVACDAGSGVGSMPMINQTGLTGGTDVYIRIWDENNDETGTFQIEARDMSDLFCYTGSATSLGGGCAQLTGAINNQNGAIWDSNDQMDFGQDFTYDFTVNLGASDAGADGMAFVMHNDSRGLATTGTSGGALGAGGIANSLIVEIDTYINTEDRDDGITGIVCSGGPEPDHLDIWLNGNVNPYADCSWQGPGSRIIPNGQRLETGGSAYNIENGLDHTLRVSYVASSQTFTAEILNAAGTVSYGSVSYSPVDPSNLFGTTTPYFGFTASTGGLNNQQTGCLPPEFAIPLPITLSNFSINCDNDQPLLSWITSSEINNDYFTIERSEDGLYFEEIARVEGAGNSEVNNSYSWQDNTLLPGVNYYRLKQTDFDGKFSYSEMVVSKCKSGADFNVYPNPSTHKFFVEFSEAYDFPVTIQIVDYLGREVYSNKIMSNIGVLEINNELPTGSYFIKVADGEQQKVQKIIKLK